MGANNQTNDFMTKLSRSGGAGYVYDARDDAYNAAKDYWNKVSSANDKLSQALGNINSSSPDSIMGQLRSSINTFNNTLAKYSGDTGYANMLNTASKGAANAATRAGAVTNQSLTSNGTNRAMAGALTGSNVANTYGNELGNQQNQVGNMYNAAINGAGQTLSANMNRINSYLTTKGQLANNAIGAAGQDVSNWNNTLTTLKNSLGGWSKLTI